MPTPLLNDVLVLATTDTLKAQLPDGGMGDEVWAPMDINTWSICYANQLRDNPHHRNQQVLEAIVRLGDFNERSFDRQKGFLNNIAGWDEWRMFAWMEAVERLSGEIDASRLQRWRDIFVCYGEHVLSQCLDMAHFDGAIPNHGIWNHALFYRIGQLYARRDFLDMASLAFERVLAGQTPDGCFREGGTSVGFPGSPVVMYNVISCMAIDMYFGHSGDPAAEQALEKGFSWYWNTLFPDFSHIAAFDCRNRSHTQSFGAEGPELHSLCIPAYFFNKPQVRGYAEAGWQLRHEPFTDERKSPNTGPYSSQALGFVSLLWDKVQEVVEAPKPEWPELMRFIALEAGTRRRHGWHVALSGISNAGASSFSLPTWRLERQSLLAIYNEKCGLIVGSGNSLMQEQASTMTFYENGCARYLHDEAYLKATPPLDTLHLRYGANIGAVSVDTTQAEKCRVAFSMLGEEGKRAERGVGHPASAMGARGRLPLQLKPGQIVRLGGKSWVLDADVGLRLRINPGEALDCGGWRISSGDAWWNFIWPIGLSNAYRPLYADEVVAIAEVALWTNSTAMGQRPTAGFMIELN